MAITPTSVDEEIYGHRNERGDWAPNELLEYPPIFVWPPQPKRILPFLKGFFLSWNLLYAALAVLFWWLLTPSPAEAANLQWQWIAVVFGRNLGITVLFYGVWHVRLYNQRRQGELFKFKRGWLKTDRSGFLWRHQTKDNIAWSLASGVPIWTAFEVLMLWSHGRGYVPHLDWSSPILFVLLMIAVPVIRDPHFYVTHRLLHAKSMYRFHKTHHINTNPGPWSGLAMHPVEHVLYFSGVVIHFVIAAHPVHFMFQLMHAGLAPATGHAGFAKVVYGDQDKPRLINSYAFNHYLHHKYFECNYSDGVFPLDRLFGTFHDGSEASHQAMRERQRSRRGDV